MTSSQAILLVIGILRLFRLDKADLNVLGSITYMAKLTLEEKRLQNLRMQLFGKERPAATKSVKQSSTENSSPKIEVKSYSAPVHTVEAAFLKQDLIKVAALSGAAIGIQFLLYFLSLRGIIHLTVFHIF